MQQKGPHTISKVSEFKGTKMSMQRYKDFFHVEGKGTLGGLFEGEGLIPSMERAHVARQKRESFKSDAR